MKSVRHVPVEGEAELIAEYSNLALAAGAGFFIPGASEDDARQECLIGLLIGIRSFDPSKGKFKSFVWMCVRRHLITCVTLATREKALPLNEAVRHTTDDDGNVVSIAEFLPDRSPSAQQLAEDRERLGRIVAAVPSLSPTEASALALVLNGIPYFSHKPTDNAIQRARRKLREAA